MPWQTLDFGAASRRLTLALAALLPAAGSAAATEPFDEADIFFELNSTDGDVGVHVSLDAESWKNLRILDPRGREIIKVEPEGSTRRIGLTELFFEGEEPPLSAVPFVRFLQLFPPGRYQFQGRTTGNEPLRSWNRLSAKLPCPVRVVSPEETQPVAVVDAVIRWEPVPGVYNPDTRVCNRSQGVVLVGYQVVAEAVDEAAGTSRSFAVDLPASVTSVRVPTEFLGTAAERVGTEFKLEILGIEQDGNKTIVERGFAVAGP